MHGLEAGDESLHAVGQRIVRRVLVGERGLAAPLGSSRADRMEIAGGRSSNVASECHRPRRMPLGRLIGSTSS